MDNKDLTSLSLSVQVYSICVPIGCMSAPGALTLIKGLKPSSRNKPWIVIMRFSPSPCSRVYLCNMNHQS